MQMSMNLLILQHITNTRIGDLSSLPSELHQQQNVSDVFQTTRVSSHDDILVCHRFLKRSINAGACYQGFIASRND
jgi:hypothetical protein